MSRSMFRERWVLPVATSFLLACGTTSLKPPPPPDRPVPASEPRDEVSARVDLKQARDCEEAFDLALYKDRAIELIAWDEHVGTCQNRHVEITYLSRKITRDEVIQTARRHAERVTVVPNEGSNDDAAK